MELSRGPFVLENVFNPDIEKLGDTKSQTYGWVIFADLKRYYSLPCNTKLAGQFFLREVVHCSKDFQSVLHLHLPLVFSAVVRVES